MKRIFFYGFSLTSLIGSLLIIFIIHYLGGSPVVCGWIFWIVFAIQVVFKLIAAIALGLSSLIINNSAKAFIAVLICLIAIALESLELWTYYYVYQLII